MKVIQELPHFPATLPDLRQVEGKAELIGDRIFSYQPMGCAAGTAIFEIACSLHEYADSRPGTKAFAGNLVYAVPQLPTGRQSFCPDSSFHSGPFPSDRRSWIEGPPTFAVEVRRWNYERDEVEPAPLPKITDYFQAGTRVVWDVDPDAGVVNCYRASNPETPSVFRVGDVADAEPAVPGWRVPVAELFPAN